MVRVLAVGVVLSCVFVVGARQTVEPVGAATFDDEYFGEFDGPLNHASEKSPSSSANMGVLVSESHDDIVITREGAISTLALAAPR